MMHCPDDIKTCYQGLITIELASMTLFFLKGPYFTLIKIVFLAFSCGMFFEDGGQILRILILK